MWYMMQRLIFILAAAFLLLHYQQQGVESFMDVSRWHGGSQTKEAGKTPKVIGGENAPPGRFPYYTGLYNQEDDIYNCGGSLIAPDVVLTAAHCWGGRYRTWMAHVGRYNLNNPKDNFESVEIAKYIPNPFYGVEAAYSSDFMLLILNNETSLSTPPIRLNHDGANPNPSQNLTVIGLGLDSSFGFFFFGSFPDILQDATLKEITNAECSRTTDGRFSYHGYITKDSICAWNPGKDSCSGDSGGPLLVQGNSNTGDDDVQVGVVSWGFGCASDTFPGVYSRVSEGVNWIDSNVCRYSSNPPPWFNCHNRTFAPDPVIPTDPDLPGKTYPITVEIDLDYHPEDTWWFILNSTGHLAYIVPRYTYPLTYEHKKIEQVVHLPVGQTYTFVIKDDGEDGISSGGYEVRLGTKSDGELLVYNYAFYGSDNRTNFTLSSSLTPAPTMSPTRSKAPTISPAPTLPVRAVTLTFNFAYSYQSGYFGYDFLNAAGQVVDSAPIGSFGYYNYTVEKTVHLPKDEKYTFVIKSESEYLYPGNCTVVLGRPGAEGPVLVASNGTFAGSFTFEEQHTFFLPSSFSVAPSLSPSEIPSLNPTITPRPTGPLQALTFTINFGYRSDSAYFGYILLNSRNRTVANETYGTFYGLTAQRVLHVSSEEEYTFVLLNELGDNLYPGNYSIAVGLPDKRGPVVAPNYRDDYFFESNEIVTTSTFFVPSSFSPAPSMAPTRGSFVTLSIDFAGYPTEVGYSILDVFQYPLIEVPIGTFGLENKTIEQVIPLPAGLQYTFVIEDFFGDGQFPGKFSLITGTPGSGGKTVVSQTGIKGFKEKFTFTLAVPSPTVPTTTERPVTPPTPTPVVSSTPSIVTTPISTSGGMSATTAPSSLAPVIATATTPTDTPSVATIKSVKPSLVVQIPTKLPSSPSTTKPNSRSNNNNNVRPSGGTTKTPKRVKMSHDAKGGNVTKGFKRSGKKKNKMSLKKNNGE